MDRWVGKLAVVTGASGGIGAAITVALANQGVNVVGFARRSHLIEELRDQVTGTGKIYARACDLGNIDDITASFEWVEQKFGGVDILVNNAALLFHGHITDVGPKALSDVDIASEVDVNLKGVILATRRAVSSMTKRNFDGHIVNINSIAGHYVPLLSILNVYPATKYGVTAFTQALATELAEFGNRIKTTSISPGLVATEMAKLNRMPELQEAVKLCPILKPSDVADAVVYAISSPPHINISELTIQAIMEKRM